MGSGCCGSLLDLLSACAPNGSTSLISVKCRGLSCRQNAVRVRVLDLNTARTVLCSSQPIDAHVEPEIRPGGDVVCDGCNLGDSRLPIGSCVVPQKGSHFGAVAEVEVDSYAHAPTCGVRGAGLKVAVNHHVSVTAPDIVVFQPHAPDQSAN
jgi:hypothetical protein